MDCKIDFINYLQWLRKLFSSVLGKVPCQGFGAFPGAYRTDLWGQGEWLQIWGLLARSPDKPTAEPAVEGTVSFRETFLHEGKERTKKNECLCIPVNGTLPMFPAFCLYCNRVRGATGKQGHLLGHGFAIDSNWCADLNITSLLPHLWKVPAGGKHPICLKLISILLF